MMSETQSMTQQAEPDFRTIAFLMMRMGLTIELMATKPVGEKAEDPLRSWLVATGAPS